MVFLMDCHSPGDITEPTQTLGGRGEGDLIGCGDLVIEWEGWVCWWGGGGGGGGGFAANLISLKVPTTRRMVPSIVTTPDTKLATANPRAFFASVMMAFVCAVVSVSASSRETAAASTPALLVSTAGDVWGTMIGSLRRGGRGRGEEGMSYPSPPNHVYFYFRAASV
jgi:hypothetical protein